MSQPNPDNHAKRSDGKLLGIQHPTSNIQLLAFDFGASRIGIANGQTRTGTAQPLAVLKARDGQPDWQQVSRLIEEWQPNLLLVGLPLNMDGSESDFCLRARKFAKRLQGRFGLEVLMVDERLSTVEAKALAGEISNKKSSYRDNPVDAIAAQLILQTWLADQGIGQKP